MATHVFFESSNSDLPYNCFEFASHSNLLVQNWLTGFTLRKDITAQSRATDTRLLRHQKETYTDDIA